MIEIILEVIWFFLPAAVANTMPIFAARYNWLSSLNIPIDRGALFRGKRLLGDNKTIRGFIIGVLFAGLIGYIQYLIYMSTDWAQEISLMPYSNALLIILFACALGFGALLGDVVKSFLKRQLNIASGSQWIIADQIDYVVGATLIAYLFIALPIVHVVTAFIIFSIGSFVVSTIGVATKIKKSL